eukprot:comp17836_c0_seq1/m.17983 comp17836_c0_seq1/g.17983  ORF comp17836_c0_seq1/g.17983 comp17836_c0_seq1/m.17983 type:complete len:286 (-) comp17836_c0_seq1:184-1041(-)
MQGLARAGQQLLTHTTACLKQTLPRTLARSLYTNSHVATQLSRCLGTGSLRAARLSSVNACQSTQATVSFRGFSTSGSSRDTEKAGVDGEKEVQAKDEDVVVQAKEENVVIQVKEEDADTEAALGSAVIEERKPEDEFQILECGQPETVDGLWPLRDVRLEAPNDVKAVWDLIRSENCSDLVAIDVRRRTNHTDYFVIATCRSARHAKAVATEIVRQFKGSRRKGLDLTVEGGGSDGWMVVNMSDIHVHLMELSARKTYELEKLWLLGNQDDQLKAAREADRRAF